MLARGAASEVAAGDKDVCVLVGRFVERMIRILLPVILKRVLADAVEGDAAEVSRGNDPVGVDVVKKERQAGSGDLFDFLHD